MKKLFLLIVLLLPLVAFSGESLMLINPSRETFINFPSAIMPDKTVTVFLPEVAVPLHRKYPVVYLLGATPQDAQAAQEALEKNTQKAILVGINFTDKDFDNAARITKFFAQELVPYIDTNYPTFSEPDMRAVAVYGAKGAQVLQTLLARKEVLGRVVLVHGGEKAITWANMYPSMRILAVGTRAELAAWQESWLGINATYGEDFVTKIALQETLFGALNLDYLFAPAAKVLVQDVEGAVAPKVLSLSKEETATLNMTAELANGQRFDVLPADVRMSPPYLNWDVAAGTLAPIAGATKGKVKISTFVDKIPFEAKVKLKK